MNLPTPPKPPGAQHTTLRKVAQGNASDFIHGSVVLIVVIVATVFAILAHDHSDNIWIVYGSAIAFAAGRSGAAVVERQQARSDDRQQS